MTPANALWSWNRNGELEERRLPNLDVVRRYSWSEVFAPDVATWEGSGPDGGNWGNPGDLVWVNGSLWVAPTFKNGAIAVVPEAGSSITHTPQSTYWREMTSDGETVWVANADGGLTAIRAADDAVITVNRELGPVCDVVFDRGSLWATIGSDVSPDRLVRLDPTTLAVTQSVPFPAAAGETRNCRLTPYSGGVLVISSRLLDCTVLTTRTDAGGQLSIADAGLPADVCAMVADGRDGVYTEGPNPPDGKDGLSIDHYVFHDGAWKVEARVGFAPAMGKVALVGTISAGPTQVAFGAAVTTKELADGAQPVASSVSVFPTE